MAEKQKRRLSWIDHNLSPMILLVNGLILLGLTLLRMQLPAKLLLFGWVMLLNILRRRKIRFGFMAVFSLSLILVNLYPPFGEILFSIFGFPITRDNLLAGFRKSVTFATFILIARYALSSQLSFPGVPGRVLARTLFYLGIMQQRRQKWEKGRLIDRIDALILELWQQGEPQEPLPQLRSTKAGLCFALVHTLILIILLYLV